jgi:MFS transporter, SP family, general alpha glucoside:H+ symporter
MAEPMTNPSEKHEEVRLEGVRADIDDVKVDGYDSYGLVKSRYDELSIPRTLWVFKRVILVSLAVYTGYVCEGFEVSLSPPSRKYTRWCAVVATVVIS